MTKVRSGFRGHEGRIAPLGLVPKSAAEEVDLSSLTPKQRALHEARELGLAVTEDDTKKDIEAAIEAHKAELEAAESNGVENGQTTVTESPDPQGDGDDDLEGDPEVEEVEIPEEGQED